MIDGLDADVVTLALAYDIDAIADRGLLAAGLAEAAAAERLALHLDDRVPGPQGQPEEHQGLGRSREAGRQGDHAESEDLRRRALELPRRLGLRAEEVPASEAKAKEFVTAIYANVPVLDTGARGSTITFVQRGIGDVLLAWENEAFLAHQRARQGQVRHRRSLGYRSWPSRRWPSSTRWSTRRARVPRPRPT